MRTSSQGQKLVQHFEGCKLTAYPDPKTGGDPWTIGWGHTGRDVYRGLTWSQEKADQMLSDDLLPFERAVSAAVKVKLTQSQFDALVSFTYNLGAGNLRSSTLLKMLNAGNYQGAADQFLRWVSPGSKVERGLRRRRTAERALFLGKSVEAAIAEGAKA